MSPTLVSCFAEFISQHTRVYLLYVTPYEVKINTTATCHVQRIASLSYYLKSFSTSEGRYRCCLGTLEHVLYVDWQLCADKPEGNRESSACFAGFGHQRSE